MVTSLSKAHLSKPQATTAPTSSHLNPICCDDGDWGRIHLSFTLWRWSLHTDASVWWLGICTVTATQLFQTVKVTIKMTDLPSSGSVCPYFSPSACKSQRYSRNPSAPHSFTLQPRIPSHRLKRNTHALKLGVEVSSCLVPFDPLRSQKEARADRGHGSVQYLGFDDSLRQT